MAGGSVLAGALATACETILSGGVTAAFGAARHVQVRAGSITVTRHTLAGIAVLPNGSRLSCGASVQFLPSLGLRGADSFRRLLGRHPTPFKRHDSCPITLPRFDGLAVFARSPWLAWRTHRKAFADPARAARCCSVLPNESRISCVVRRPPSRWTCSLSSGRRATTASCAG